MSEIGLMSPPPLGRVDVPNDEVASCRVCGCTDLEACPEGCWWVEDPEAMGDLCSSCADRLASTGEGDVVAGVDDHP